MKNRLSLDNVLDSFEAISDPYSHLTFKIPSVQDRILDAILEMLVRSSKCLSKPFHTGRLLFDNLSEHQ